MTDFTKLPDYEKIKITPVFGWFTKFLEGQILEGQALVDAWLYFRGGCRLGRTALFDELEKDFGLTWELVPA